MPLSEIVERAARQLDQAADRLERGMGQVGAAGGRLGQAAAAGMPAWAARFNAAEAARAAQWPAIHAQRAAEQAARRGGGLAAGLASGAAEALVGHALRGMNPVPAATPGIPIVAHGGPGAAQEALAAQYRAAQAGTALAVLARETVQAAAAAAVFTMTLRRAAGLAPVPPGGGGGPPLLPGPANGVGFPGGPVVPYGGPRVRVVGATANQPGAGGRMADAMGGWDAQVRTFSWSLRALNPAVLAATGAFYTALRLVEKANPSAAATFTGSLDLLSAKIGRTLVPVIDEASRSLQGLGGVVDAARPLLSALNSRRNPLSIPGMLGPVNDLLQSLGLAGPMMRSVRTGLQGGAAGGEEYALSLQSAGLQNDQLQTELLRLQYEALQEWLGTSRSIAADVAALRAQGPNFV